MVSNLLSSQETSSKCGAYLTKIAKSSKQTNLWWHVIARSRKACAELVLKACESRVKKEQQHGKNMHMSCVAKAKLFFSQHGDDDVVFSFSFGWCSVIDAAVGVFFGALLPWYCWRGECLFGVVVWWY